VKALRHAFLAICALVMLGVADAHDSAPLRSADVRVGPHAMTVTYHTEPRGGGVLEFVIHPAGAPADTIFEVQAVPGSATAAVPVRAELEPQSDHIEGRVTLPVSGQWLLEITASNPAPGGPTVAQGFAPVLAGAPPVIPVWLGWLIGLLPVAVMMAFVLRPPVTGGARGLT